MPLLCSTQFYSAVMSSNFRTHSNYRPLKTSGSAAWKRTHYSGLPCIFKYVGFWVSLKPLWVKHSYTELLLVAQESMAFSLGVFCFHLGQFPHFRLLRHLWQVADWPSLGLQIPHSGLPLPCFVTLGHSELPVPRYRVKRAPLSYPIQERGEEKDFDVKGALSSLAGRRFIM